jgi:chloride channel 3/4/5
MGVYGAIFCKLNILWARTFRGLEMMRRVPVVEVLMVVLTTAVVGYYNPYTRISGTRLVEDLLSECGSAADGFDGVCPRTEAGILELLKLLSFAFVVKIFLCFPELKED